MTLLGVVCAVFVMFFGVQDGLVASRHDEHFNCNALAESQYIVGLQSLVS